MKPYIDFCTTLSIELQNKNRVHNKLRKHWGVTRVNGVEVFNRFLFLWPTALIYRGSMLKAAKIFNITEKDIFGHAKDGVEHTFLYFNPVKLNTASYNREGIANLLEAQVPFDEWREFSITYTDSKNPDKFVGYSKEMILKYVKDNYRYESMRVGLSTNGKLTGIDEFLGPYVLQDNGVDFVVEALDAEVTAIAVKTVDHPYASISSKYAVTQTYQSGISVAYRYKRTGHLNDDSPVVSAIMSGLAKDPLDSYSITRNLMKHISPPATDTIWYNGQLRTDIVKNFKAQDYFKIVYGSIDIEQIMEKPKGNFLTKAVGVILAVVVFVFTLGTGTAISVAILATAFAAAALTLTLYSMAMAMMGYPGTAMYIGRWAKVVGIVATVLGIAAAIQSLAQNLASNAARASTNTAATNAATGTASASTGAATAVGTEVAATAASEITLDVVVDTAVSMLKDSITNASPLSMASTASKVISPLVELREKNKLKDLKTVQDEVRAQESVLADMYDKNGHFGLEDIRTYTKPLTTSMLQYEIDWLYEEGPNNILRPSFARFGMNIISNDVLPITARKGYLSNLTVQ